MARIHLLLLGLALLGCALALPQEKSVKGGPHASSFRYNATANLDRFQQNTTDNHTAPRNPEMGVCYEEVPTASLVRDQAHVPAGNGSRPGMSRIRTCCKGYARNLHNFRRCEPVCTQECVNALCTAPEVCTCFPDHVHNAAGYCVPTCPIGCQNGQCAGGECLCKPGYKLDAESKYCLPTCKDNCGGHGNCTAPDQCECSKDYRLGPDGSCRASCGDCTNGDCAGPNLCVCHKGYAKNEHNECVPVCSKGCIDGICIAPDVCTCSYGYDLKEDQGRCEPKCLTPCLNGVCTGPDTCTCKPGYAVDKADPTGSRCVPNCPAGCPNGVCSMPNFCICNFGYVKDRSVKGAAACVKRVRRSLDVRSLLTFAIPE